MCNIISQDALNPLCCELLFFILYCACFYVILSKMHLISVPLNFVSVFSGCRAGWTCRCALLTTAAATKTAMLKTAGQRPASTHRSRLWYAPQSLYVLCVFVSLHSWEDHSGGGFIVPLTLLPVQSKQSSSLSDRDTGEEDSDPLDDCGGFWRVQRRLQEEARVALALARPMARMQVEVERQIQLHRRSPVADLVSQTEREQGI